MSPLSEPSSPVNFAASDDPRLHFAALYDQQQTGHLELLRGFSQTVVRADAAVGQLFEADFCKPAPQVEVVENIVRIRAVHFHPFSRLKGTSEIRLHPGIPWHITLHGGASHFRLELADTPLFSLTMLGGLSDAKLVLPAAFGQCPIRLAGGASHLEIYRPPHSPVRLTLLGGLNAFSGDGHQTGAVGGRFTWQSPNFTEGSDGYDLEITGGVHHLTLGTLP